MAKKTTPSSDSARFTDIRRVKELIALMANNGLSEIELVEDKSRILLRRGVASSGAVPVAHPTLAMAPHPPALAPSSAAPPAEDADLIPIKSPMVGTFYSAPNPETDAYVTIGKIVDPKTVICIIEAMKVFNEIHAETSGTVVKILVANGQTVEFGQPMFLVRPE